MQAARRKLVIEVVWLQSLPADVFGGLSVFENSSVISDSNRKASWIYDYLELRPLDGRSLRP